MADPTLATVSLAAKKEFLLARGVGPFVLAQSECVAPEDNVRGHPEPTGVVMKPREAEAAEAEAEAAEAAEAEAAEAEAEAAAVEAAAVEAAEAEAAEAEAEAEAAVAAVVAQPGPDVKEATEAAPVTTADLKGMVGRVGRACKRTSPCCGHTAAALPVCPLAGGANQALRMARRRHPESGDQADTHAGSLPGRRRQGLRRERQVRHVQPARTAGGVDSEVHRAPSISAVLKVFVNVCDTPRTDSEADTGQADGQE